jgi:hypothetical protein
MKYVVTVLSVLLFLSVVSAQNPPPAPTGIPHHDTMQMGINVPDGEAGPMAMCQRGEMRLFPGHGMNFKQEKMEPGCGGAQCPGFLNAHQRMSGLRGMRGCPRLPFFFTPPICCVILLLGILLWGIINILLTIIVSLDMTKNSRFNGLWIPVLLIAGIPGSIIYALFRIGDKIPCKNT